MGSLDLDSSSDSEGEARRPTNSMSDSNSDNEPSSGNNVAARIDSSDRYLKLTLLCNHSKSCGCGHVNSRTFFIVTSFETSVIRKYLNPTNICLRSRDNTRCRIYYQFSKQ